MKKFFYLLFAGSAMLLASCATSPEDVANKIGEGKELSQEDYKVLLEYSRDVMNRLGDTLDVYQNNREGLVGAMKTMAEQEPIANIFMEQLMRTDTATLDPANKKLYMDLYKAQMVNADKFMQITSMPTIGIDGNMIGSESDEVEDVKSDSVTVSVAKPADGVLEAPASDQSKL